MKYTLHDILNLHTVEDLKALSKEFGITGYSKKKKQDLIETMQSAILQEEYAEEKFLVATDMDIATFEKAISKKVVIEDNPFLYYYWENLCFAFVTIQGEVQIPLEVQQLYRKIKQSQRYKETRQRMLQLSEYSAAATNLYGAIKVEKLVEIMNEQTDLNTNPEEMVRWCITREVFRGCQLFCYQEGYVTEELYGDNLLGVEADFRELLAHQQDKPYYIPEKEEFLKYADSIYIEENQSYRDMLHFMISFMGMDRERAEDICAETQLLIRSGAVPSKIFQEYERMGVTFSGEKVLAGYTKLLMDMNNNTRMSENRGYTPNEVRKLMPERSGITPELLEQIKEMGFPVESLPLQSKIINFPGNKRTEAKVYPNDACPCGSGKKYKKCCSKRLK